MIGTSDQSCWLAKAVKILLLSSASCVEVHSQWPIGVMTRGTVALQMGFFSIVGIPLFKAMAELFEETKPMLDAVLANNHHWEFATPDVDLPP